MVYYCSRLSRSKQCQTFVLYLPYCLSAIVAHTTQKAVFLLKLSKLEFGLPPSLTD